MDNTFDDGFILIAHRGASSYKPENTMLSFQKAIELGAKIIEFDVRKSLDGHLVVMHDSKVNRTTNGDGKVNNINLAELNNLDAGNGEKIPTVEDVLILFKGKGKFVIELKEENTEKQILDMIYKYDLANDVILVSFKKRVLKRLRALDGNITTGLITLTGIGCVRTAVELGCRAVATHVYLATKNKVQNAHENGLLFFCWTTDDKRKCLELKRKGVDGVITNKPDLLER